MYNYFHSTLTKYAISACLKGSLVPKGLFSDHLQIYTLISFPKLTWKRSGELQVVSGSLGAIGANTKSRRQLDRHFLKCVIFETCS